jgi:UDP-glucose 4-epimerase
MRILIMGGTRFIGVYLTQLLVEQGHEVVLFNRGNRTAPSLQRVGQIITRKLRCHF